MQLEINKCLVLGLTRRNPESQAPDPKVISCGHSVDPDFLLSFVFERNRYKYLCKQCVTNFLGVTLCN